LVSKTKFVVIDELMSVPALEVVDQTAGIHCGFAAQPAVFAGCGPLFNTSTLFWAARGATVVSNMAPKKDNNGTFFIASPYAVARLRNAAVTSEVAADLVPNNSFPGK
jgi:hypothetical protein